MSQSNQVIANQLEIKDPSKIRLILSAMDAMMDETNIEIMDQGIIVRGMPSNHVSLVDVFIPSTVFTQYSFTNMPVKFRLRIKDLLKLLTRSKTSDTLTIAISHHRLQIIIRSDYTKQYSLSVMEFKEEEDKLPKLSMPVTIQTDPATLKDLLDDIALVSEFIVIHISRNKEIDLSGQDDLKGAHLAQFSHSTLNITDYDEENLSSDLQSKFRLDIFDKLVSTLKTLNTPITIELGPAMPMRITYNIQEFAKLHLFVAPLEAPEKNE